MARPGEAVERVRAKLDYTNIAYGLQPGRFTLRRLQWGHGCLTYIVNRSYASPA